MYQVVILINNDSNSNLTNTINDENAITANISFQTLWIDTIINATQTYLHTTTDAFCYICIICDYRDIIIMI